MSDYLCITDGACEGNGRAGARGGWAAVVRGPDGAERVLSGAEASSTNNRMELTAALEALRACPSGARVEVVSDSRYLIDALTKGWTEGWIRRGWVTASGGPVANRPLWEALLAERARMGAVRFTWVRGHAGHAGNERVDGLARAAAARGPDGPAPGADPVPAPASEGASGGRRAPRA